MDLTPGLLHQIMPNLSSASAEPWLPLLASTFAEFDISSPIRRAAFLAQVGHESAEFSRLIEDLRYSAQGLLATWPHRFTTETAAAYARQPEKIANLVYANRGGNGDEASGDGWRYRGRGLLQRTFHDAYAHDGSTLSLPLLADPDLGATPPVACRTAGLYWKENGLNELADGDRFTRLTEVINGGTIGLADRLLYYGRAKRALGLLPQTA